MSGLVLIGLLALLLAGRTRIAFAVGLASLGYLVLFMPGVDLETVAQRMYAGADSFALTAIPFFVLVGELMSRGGISERLVHLARTLVGHLTGGMGLVQLVVSAIFASFSGSAVANAAGTGSITIPAMIRSRYPRGLAAAMESTSSSLGAIIPPSIPMIIYGTTAGVSIGALFIAGYVPAALLALALAVGIRRAARRHQVPVDPRPSIREIGRATWRATPALATPVVIMGGILGGVMTPTEAGAVGALYALLVGAFGYRELRIREIGAALAGTARTTGVVMLVMTTASLFSWILAFERIPQTVAEAVLSQLTDPRVIMLLVVALLLVAGMVIDTISALIVLVPVLTPVAVVAGVDPLAAGVIMVVALTLGVCTPPVGVTLFVTSSIARTTIEDTSRAALPFVVLMVAVLVVLALFPETLLWLPRAFGF
ncbi:MAG TPA: TRAP transporter large permease [Natronosporangium sp.]